MAKDRPSFDERVAALIENPDSATHKAVFGDKPKSASTTKSSGSSSTAKK